LLYVEKLWWIKESNISIGGEIDSPFLRIINFVHKIVRFFNIIPEQYTNLSNLINDILPVIDIGQTMDLLIGKNYYVIDERPDMIILCVNNEIIDVHDKSYDCYNITLMGIGNIYYSSEVGNIIKITFKGEKLIEIFQNIPFGDWFLSISDIKIELLETNN